MGFWIKNDQNLTGLNKDVSVGRREAVAMAERFGHCSAVLVYINIPKIHLIFRNSI